eukprot:358296-Chlamydomonas_euryale.AAC.7
MLFGCRHAPKVPRGQPRRMDDARRRAVCLHKRPSRFCTRQAICSWRMAQPAPPGGHPWA